MNHATLMLLGFAAWTLFLLTVTVGTYRWSRILTRRQGIAEFRSDHVEGDDWYRRAMRAHANCVENLPVFAVIVFALNAAGASSPLIDGLATLVLAARLVQSLVHVGLPQTNRVVSVRFSFFMVQVACFAGLMACGVLAPR
jgi:uncharacterized MAPEG superfamily protein